MDKESIGQRIKILRTQREMTQDDLVMCARGYIPAGKKMPRNMISRYEHGRSYPDSWVIQAIAKALDTSVQYLMGETEDPSPTVRPALTPVPVFWHATKELNKQPPHLQRLAAQAIDAMLAYAREYGEWANSQDASEQSHG